MSNKINEKYFNYNYLKEQEEQILNEILNKTNFKIEKLIFKGKIYDDNKTGSLIYKGSWKDKPAVLKIQILPLEIDEIDIIENFNKQNKSKIIRLPLLYDGMKRNKNYGYGYLILEYIDAPKIYRPPFAKKSQIKDFCKFYQEYKTNCLNKPWIEKDPIEQNSLIYALQRVFHWLKIRQTKKDLHINDIKYLEKFIKIASQYLPSFKMEFMHGHLTYDDIFKISDNDYVIMSNLFRSYRPEFYDATFHIGMALEQINSKKITTSQIIEYIQIWLDEYKKLPVISDKKDFERKFNIMLLERLIGAIILDIYILNKSYLLNLFIKLFDHFENKLK